MVTAPGTRTDIASRVFAAYHGIDEDPVTGSAHARWCPTGRPSLAGPSSPPRRSARAAGCSLPAGRRPGAARRARRWTVIEGSFQL
jgi:hypothetical protein